MTLGPQFKRYQGNPASPASKGYGDLPTRELISGLHSDANRLNSLMDRGHTGEGYGDLSKMTYTPGELNYRGHMAIMVRDVAMSQRAHADGLAAKGIKVPVLDMMDEKTRVNWAKRRKKDF